MIIRIVFTEKAPGAGSGLGGLKLRVGGLKLITIIPSIHDQKRNVSAIAYDTINIKVAGTGRPIGDNGVYPVYPPLEPAARLKNGDIKYM